MVASPPHVVSRAGKKNQIISFLQDRLECLVKKNIYIPAIKFYAFGQSNIVSEFPFLNVNNRITLINDPLNRFLWFLLVILTVSHCAIMRLYMCPACSTGHSRMYTVFIFLKINRIQWLASWKSECDSWMLCTAQHKVSC